MEEEGTGEGLQSIQLFPLRLHRLRERQEQKTLVVSVFRI